MLELRSGDVFAGCKIITLCGKGGYGTVYLAEDAAGKKIAVKLINTNEKERELQGIKNYMQLSHSSPYLLPVYHVGIEHNELYLLMAAADPITDSTCYLPDTLARRLQLNGKVAPAEALEIIRKIASAVKSLHDSKLIHRDIKPDNVIFVNGEPMLSDPGLICSTERTISLAGTLGFLPPECFYGDESNSMQSDIYALGKLFYCIVTGESPGRFPHLPRDLSFSLCRKLLPILLRSCNTRKKKRYTAIEEFQRDLPKKLPRPGLISRFNEAFRTWRLLHCVLWNTILLALFAAIVISGVMFYRHREQKKLYLQKIAAFKAETAAFAAKINRAKTTLSLQLERLYGKRQGVALMKRYSTLPANTASAVEASRQYSRELNSSARAAAQNNLLICDAMKRAAAKRAFLHSPLAQFLNNTQKSELISELLQDEKKHREQLGNRLVLEKTFSPDSSGIFEFSYIPPGDFISPVSGKKGYIDYPFWVAPAKLTVRQFSRMAHFLPPRSTDQELPAVRFLWNDLLQGCSNAFETFQIVAPFPPGYIVRPLTETEWEYCVSRGVKDMGGTISEIVIGSNHKYADSVIALRNSKKGSRREFVFYQSFMANTGTRIAIAPGTPDFYQKELKIGSAQHIEFNGRHYEYFGHLCANFSRDDAENICHMLGGRLASLDSPELIEKINTAASPAIRYNTCVAADFRNGNWFWANGKPVEKSPPPPEKGKFFTMKGRKFTLDTTKRYLGFVCEWSQEEWRARRNWKARLKEFPQRHSFTIGNKEYTVFKMFLNYPHLFRRYAEILGGRLAELETPEIRKAISEKVRDFSSNPILLGGYWHNTKYFWFTSKNEIEQPLEIIEVIDPAPSLAAVALQHDRLCASQAPRQFLVEFPIPTVSR